MAEAAAIARRRWGGGLAALALVALAVFCAAAARPWLFGDGMAMLFLLAVLVSAVGFGLGPGLLAAFAAAVAYNYFFLEPRFSFRIGRAGDLLTYGVFFAVALLAGGLAGRARDAAEGASRRARTIAVLLEASRGLSAAATPDQAAQALTAQAAASGGGAAVVLLPGPEGLRVAGGPPGVARLGEAAATAAEAAWRTGEVQAAEPGWRFRTLEGLHGRVGSSACGPTTRPPTRTRRACWPRSSSRGPWRWSGRASPRRRPRTWRCARPTACARRC
jgi:two-component system sensor histidine kinase KdpD